MVGPKVPDHAEPEAMIVGEGLQPEWYKSITLEWVMDAKERFRLLMAYLAELFGLPESDHLHSSSGHVLAHDDPPA